MTIPKIRRVILEPAAREYPLATQALRRLNGVPLSSDPALHGAEAHGVSWDDETAVQRDMGKEGYGQGCASSAQVSRGIL
ncbi:MAG: hypothetical protein JRK53_15275 [Deltaproteobacteria bacterium]|nr:hypothetical protein [Deltaproteobacteria bacterium]